MSFKIESSNQEISLQRKAGRIYDSPPHTVRIIYKNKKIYIYIKNTPDLKTIRVKDPLQLVGMDLIGEHKFGYH